MQIYRYLHVKDGNYHLTIRNVIFLKSLLISFYSLWLWIHMFVLFSGSNFCATLLFILRQCNVSHPDTHRATQMKVIFPNKAIEEMNVQALQATMMWCGWVEFFWRKCQGLASAADFQFYVFFWIMAVINIYCTIRACAFVHSHTHLIVLQ